MYTISGTNLVILIIALLFVLAVIIGTIILQIHLSKKENKWLGLILPALSLLLSLSVLLGFLLFTPVTGSISTMVDGEIVTETFHYRADLSTVIIRATMLFLLMNIPTAVNLIIYAACRSKQRAKRALDKMSVQDL